MVALDDWTGGDQDSRLLSFRQGDVLVPHSHRLTCCLTPTVSFAASLPPSHLLSRSHCLALHVSISLSRSRYFDQAVSLSWSHCYSVVDPTLSHTGGE